MLEPRGFDGFGDSVALQSFLEELFAAREVSAHNRVFGVHLIERPTLVFYRRAEKFRSELVFHFFDALFVGMAKEETDHAVGEDAVDEIADNAPQADFSAQLLEAGLHRSAVAVE
jgi:hypothetical protein